MPTAGSNGTRSRSGSRNVTGDALITVLPCGKPVGAVAVIETRSDTPVFTAAAGTVSSTPSSARPGRATRSTPPLDATVCSGSSTLAHSAVATKRAGGSVPTRALTTCRPVAGPSVQMPALAVPSVPEVAVALPIDPPPESTANVTATPGSARPPASRTTTARGTDNATLGSPDCPSPLCTVSDAGVGGVTGGGETGGVGGVGVEPTGSLPPEQAVSSSRWSSVIGRSGRRMAGASAEERAKRGVMRTNAACRGKAAHSLRLRRDTPRLTSATPSSASDDGSGTDAGSRDSA